MKKNIDKYVSVIIAVTLLNNIAYANNIVSDSDSIFDMDLESIIKTPITPEVSVASKNDLSIKKSPGIVTLITEKEIINSGARDLQEVLNLVPGFVFNLDVQGQISTGFRGIWAQEGKCLVLIDGQEMNDVLWPTIVFGNRFPVTHIKRVEVLRGPGSAIYGGQAELTVINVVTKQAKDLKGFSTKINWGSIYNNPSDFTHRNMSFSFGQEFGDLGISLHGLLGKGNRSDKVFKDFYGGSFDMTGKMETNPTFFNLGLNYKDFSARFITDLYRTTTQSLFSNIIPDSIGAIPVNHDGYYAELKYNIKPFNFLTMTPKFNYKRQYPWQSNTEQVKKLTELEGFEGSFFDKMVERYTGNMTLTLEPNDNFNILAGGEMYQDKSYALDSKSADFGLNKDQKFVQYNNIALFSQGIYKNDYLSFTLGSRFENHSAYGASFVPRVALAGDYEGFHSKLIYSKAFRAPSIQNITNFNPKFSKGSNIKPENTTISEIEFGYDFSSNMSLTANLFDIQLENPIVYFSDNENDAYDNFEKTGSRGFELEYRIKDKKLGYANLTYSFNLANDNTVSLYEVPNQPDILLGFPKHKFTLNSNINIFENFSINPSLIFFSQRNGVFELDKDENSIIKEFEPVFLFNLNLIYKNFFFKGVNASISGHNLLNQTYHYIQAYNGTHAPISGASTEISFNIGYDFY